MPISPGRGRGASSLTGRCSKAPTCATRPSPVPVSTEPTCGVPTRAERCFRVLARAKPTCAAPTCVGLSSTVPTSPERGSKGRAPRAWTGRERRCSPVRSGRCRFRNGRRKSLSGSPERRGFGQRLALPGRYRPIPEGTSLGALDSQQAAVLGV